MIGKYLLASSQEGIGRPRVYVYVNGIIVYCFFKRKAQKRWIRNSGDMNTTFLTTNQNFSDRAKLILNRSLIWKRYWENYEKNIKKEKCWTWRWEGKNSLEAMEQIRHNKIFLYDKRIWTVKKKRWTRNNLLQYIQTVSMNWRQAGVKIVNEKFHVFRKARAMKMLKTKIENKYEIEKYHPNKWWIEKNLKPSKND